MIRTEYAFDVENSVLRQLGSEFANNNKRNWTATQSDSWDEFYSEFELNLNADYAIDYMGVRVYFLNNEPVAWADDENLYGYREA